MERTNTPTMINGTFVLSITPYRVNELDDINVYFDPYFQSKCRRAINKLAALIYF